LLGGLLSLLAQSARAQAGLFSAAAAGADGDAASAAGLCLKPNGFEAPGAPPAPPAPGQVVANPALGWTGQLGSVAAVQGFVGQNLGAEPRLTDDFRAGTHCGLLLQCPIQPVCDPARQQQVLLFVNARGGFRYEESLSTHVPTWTLLPGIEWRFRENLRMRVGGNADDLISCWWRY
jgi:hypothetical protein